MDLDALCTVNGGDKEEKSKEEEEDKGEPPCKVCNDEDDKDDGMSWTSFYSPEGKLMLYGDTEVWKCEREFKGSERNERRKRKLF